MVRDALHSTQDTGCVASFRRRATDGRRDTTGPLHLVRALLLLASATGVASADRRRVALKLSMQQCTVSLARARSRARAWRLRCGNPVHQARGGRIGRWSGTVGDWD